tara:strand:+ start:876 stop:1217 length:342 start_codon:yes stop_codon:yes gene_type:complete
MILYYMVIDVLSSTAPDMELRLEMMQELSDLGEDSGNFTIPELEELTGDITAKLMKVSDVFHIINYVCYANMLYIVQIAMSFIFLKRMGRNFDFPTLTQALDVAQFISSLILI